MHQIGLAIEMAIQCRFRYSHYLGKVLGGEFTISFPGDDFYRGLYDIHLSDCKIHHSFLWLVSIH